jgi:hypothetical protein
VGSGDGVGPGYRVVQFLTGSYYFVLRINLKFRVVFTKIVMTRD